MPKGVRTTTIVTGEMHKSDPDTEKLARTRAKKVVAYLKKSGLAGPFDIAVSVVPKNRDSDHVRVEATWGT